MRDSGTAARAAVLTATAGLVLAACTSGPIASHSRRPPSVVPAAAHPLSTALHQLTGPEQRFAHSKGPNPAAVTVLASSRNLRPGQHGAVLKVRGVGNLLGSCGHGTPGVKFQLTYRGAGPPAVTQVREPLAAPVGLHLLAPYWPPARRWPAERSRVSPSSRSQGAASPPTSRSSCGRRSRPWPQAAPSPRTACSASADQISSTASADAPAVHIRRSRSANISSALPYTGDRSPAAISTSASRSPACHAGDQVPVTSAVQYMTRGGCFWLSDITRSRSRIVG